MPIPLGKKRLRQRGYNQAGIIAKHLSKYLNLSYNDKVLKRIRETEPQHTLTLHQRRLNVMGSFAVCDKDAIIGKRILLVDDVFSSGNTIGEASNTLIRNGASSVIVATFAAAPYEGKKHLQNTNNSDTEDDKSEMFDNDFAPLSRVCPSPLFEMRKNKE